MSLMPDGTGDYPGELATRRCARGRRRARTALARRARRPRSAGPGRRAPSASARYVASYAVRSCRSSQTRPRNGAWGKRTSLVFARSTTASVARSTLTRPLSTSRRNALRASGSMSSGAYSGSCSWPVSAPWSASRAGGRPSRKSVSAEASTTITVRRALRGRRSRVVEAHNGQATQSLAGKTTDRRDGLPLMLSGTSPVKVQGTGVGDLTGHS